VQLCFNLPNVAKSSNPSRNFAGTRFGSICQKWPYARPARARVKLSGMSLFATCRYYRVFDDC